MEMQSRFSKCILLVCPHQHSDLTPRFPWRQDGPPFLGFIISFSGEVLSVTGTSRTTRVRCPARLCICSLFSTEEEVG